MGKHAKQIAIKIKELAHLGQVHDSKMLKGTSENYHRVDVGEYRIIYQIENIEIRILLIGKRNDNEVYNLFKRKIK